MSNSVDVRSVFKVFLTVPGKPAIVSGLSTDTSIPLSWSVPSGSVVTSYQLEWSYDKCSDDPVENSTTINTSSTIFNLTLSDLRPDTNYTISVSASNSVGESSREIVFVDTKEASKSYAIVQAHLNNGVPKMCVCFLLCIQGDVVYWSPVECLHL